MSRVGNLTRVYHELGNCFFFFLLSFLIPSLTRITLSNTKREIGRGREVKGERERKGERKGREREREGERGGEMERDREGQNQGEKNRKSERD